MGQSGTVLLMLVILILFIPILLIVVNRLKTRGKCVSFFLEGTLPVSPKLLKVGRDGFMEYQGRKFEVREEMMRLIQWPLGVPNILTEMVPAALYDFDTSEQLDWRKVNITKGNSSVEIGAVLDPQWLAIFIKGMKDAGGMGGGRFERMMPMLSLALGALCLLLLFVVMSKMSGLQSAVNNLSP